MLCFLLYNIVAYRTLFSSFIVFSVVAKTWRIARVDTESGPLNTRSLVSSLVDDISAFGGIVRLDRDHSIGSTPTSIKAFEGNDYDHWEDAEQWTREFHLTSADDQHFRWILGAFASDPRTYGVTLGIDF